ncbi:arginine--tRNA ligase [Croceiramulus getboli]|nr:arginine--tRNA ligase [Flavobacteriaceae bacterium YJPT1-3]
MQLQQVLTQAVKDGIKKLHQIDLPEVEFQPTRKDFAGDVTVVVFPMLRHIKGNPVQIGQELGAYLQEAREEVIDFNVIKGFLNLVISDHYYLNALQQISKTPSYGAEPASGKAVMIEYSSPNTNKPLHLGHIRNNLLGYSVAQITEAAGKKVYKTQIINDRGIHICKSMLAWKKFGNGETPESSGLKGDKLVGNYYVRFDQEYKKEIEQLIGRGLPKEQAEKEAPILLEAQELLRQWEEGDKEVVQLWTTMNDWVYAGFEQTYNNLGVSFDSYYYESNTYLLGKDHIEEGLQSGVFYKKEDGSVWCDLTDDGLDEKLVLRSDGTAVYMTQDIGTAVQRVKDHPDVGGMVYTVGNEQDYHFKVLFLILKKLGYDWAENLYHLSYGMVDLPSGKMKSREGTVVDADELMVEMTDTARSLSQELGKLEGYSETEKEELYRTIGLGALKYYILKVDPKKRILFDPQESVDFQGNTGPFIQYTYARIQSILRKAQENGVKGLDDSVMTSAGAHQAPAVVNSLHSKEKELIKILLAYPETVQIAAANYSPALIANYTYDLVKEFNSFYQNVPIFNADTEGEKELRVVLSREVAQVIKSAFALLGIEVPERM